MLKKLIIISFMFSAIRGYSQSFDLETIGKSEDIKVTAHLNANSVFYNSNYKNARLPLTYFLQGAINIDLYSLSIPLSYSLSNQGSKFKYQIPFNLNRISLHPKYKEITAHIGDVSMSFSPYSLSGHQFTGAGIDLRLKNGFSLSAMHGRLLKATPDGEDQHIIPAYKRMGTGFRAAWKNRRYNFGISTFYAKDHLKSLDSVPELKRIFPRENLVISLEGSFNPGYHSSLSATYASSAMTHDIRAMRSDVKKGVASLFFNNKTSTEFYKALKLGYNYKFDQSSVGVIYEYIDPGYETLGSYYFNSDLENITLNTNTVMLNKKVNLNFNIGYQRDNLKAQKETGSRRIVGSLNFSGTINKALTVNGNYSNFRTYTNVKANQFEVINDNNLLDDGLDTLNYRQLSQNANFNINYTFIGKNDRQQQISVNYSITDISNQQDGLTSKNNASVFHNLNTVYNLSLLKKAINISTAFNGTLNSIGPEDFITWGPSFSMNRRYYDNKLDMGLSSSFNTSSGTGGRSNITNLRFRLRYLLLNRHHFNLSAIQQFRQQTGSEHRNLREFTATLGYHYNLNLPPKHNTGNKDNIFHFTYRDHYYEGKHSEISPLLFGVSRESGFKEISNIEDIRRHLHILKDNVLDAEGKNNRLYKFTAIEYLKYLYKHRDFLDTYYTLAFKGLKKLYREALLLDHNIEKEYFSALAKFNSSGGRSEKYQSDLKIIESKYLGHQYMMQELRQLSFQDLSGDSPLLANFRKRQLSNVFSMLEQGVSTDEIQTYLEIEFADMYHKKAREMYN